jgi:imidazolonepropionase
MYQLIGPISEIVTMEGLPTRGAILDEQLSIVKNGGIVIENDYIIEVGDYNNLKRIYKGKIDQDIRIETDAVSLPGFIDSHTHLCFAGTRSMDYASRNAGMSYLEIAQRGGGIWDTVQHTRSATKNQLVDHMLLRINKLISMGITTVEVKSGYGLSVSEELKMLESIQTAGELTPIDIIPTCLAAHILPRDFDGGAPDYLNYLVQDLLPIIKYKNLCNRVDAFIERGAFSVAESRNYLMKAKQMGFDITIHADQFTPIGSSLAIEVGAVSADHLEASSDREIQLLAHSHTVATVLPGASIGLGCDFAPARRLLDAGAIMSIASDWNPGSAPMGDLLTQAAILGTFEKLRNAEVLAGITYRAAKALGLSDRGRLIPNAKADFNLFSCKDYREILYHQGQMTPSQVWKNGDLIHHTEQ